MLPHRPKADGALGRYRMYQNQYFFPPAWFFQTFSQPGFASPLNKQCINDDDVIINTTNVGAPGPPGPPGPPGVCQCNTNTRLIDSDYLADYPLDFYIGVNSTEPVTVTLPADATDGYQIVVKLEMGPPIGNRKVTVLASGTSLIDDTSSLELKTAYKFVWLIKRGDNWHTV